MAVDRSYVEENNAQRARLKALVERLSDAELARPMSAGWTVAAVLGHMAFWDQRVLVLVERWEREGSKALPPAIPRGEVDWINDSAKALCLALPPRAAARLALSVAEACDQKVGALPDDRVAANAGAGQPLNLRRAEHRREHLDEIERALGR